MKAGCTGSILWNTGLLAGDNYGGPEVVCVVLFREKVHTELGVLLIEILSLLIS